MPANLRPLLRRQHHCVECARSGVPPANPERVPTVQKPVVETSCRGHGLVTVPRRKVLLLILNTLNKLNTLRLTDGQHQGQTSVPSREGTEVTGLWAA